MNSSGRPESPPFVGTRQPRVEPSDGSWRRLESQRHAILKPHTVKRRVWHRPPRVEAEPPIHAKKQGRQQVPVRNDRRVRHTVVECPLQCGVSVGLRLAALARCGLAMRPFQNVADWRRRCYERPAAMVVRPRFAW